MKGKRWISLLLCLCLLCSLTGPLPIRAADPAVSYAPAVAGVYLLPEVTVEHISFVRTQVLTEEGLLVNDFFGSLQGSSLSVSGENKNELSPGNTYMHSENKKWSASYSWNMESMESMDALQSLIESKQITVNVSAALTADRHMHIGSHGTLTDRARVQVQYTSDGKQKTTLTLQNGQDDPDEVARTYTGSKTLPASAKNGLTLTMGGTDCSCGSSKVSKTYVYFSDLTAPTLSRAYVSDSAGNETSRTAYKAGEKAYITLEMSEPVRFADGVSHDLELQLNLLSSETGQSTDKTITAHLVSLTGNKLIFSYDVESGMNHFVTSVEPQSWVNQETGLALLDESGQPMNMGDFTADGLVTDLAGNALSWTSGQMLEENLVLDNDAPGYTRLNLQGNMTQGYKADANGDWPEDITPSATWAGVGDYLSLTPTLDEEVGLWTGDVYAALEANDVKAVLNVNKDGNPVKLNLAEVSYAPDGVNAVRNSTTLTWAYFRPEEGMTMAEGEENEPIRILRLEAADGSSTLGDPAGNMLKTSLGDLAPVEKLNLDVTAPAVTLKKDEISRDSNYITVPFTIAEEENGSGADPEQEVTVSLQISCDGTLWYRIDDSATAPAISTDGDNYTSWLDRSPLPTPDGSGNYYLHIYAAKLGNYADPSTGQLPIGVSITAQDYAGNQGTGSLGEYSVKTDTTGPTITLPETFSVSGEAGISVPFSVSDASHLQSITVQWNDGSETPVSDLAPGSATYSGTAVLNGLTGEGTAALKVVATDVAGNVAEKSYTYSYNMTSSARYTLKSPPGVVTGNPGLELHAPARVGNAETGTGMTTLAVLEPKSGIPLIYAIDSSGSPFEIFSDGNLDKVSASCQGVAADAGTVTIDRYQSPASTGSWDPVYTYGDIKVTLVTLPTSEWTTLGVDDTTITIPDTTDHLAVEQFTIKAAQAFDKDATGANNAQEIYTIDFQTPKNAEGNSVSNAIASNVTGSTVSVQTLTGLTVPLTISRANHNYSDYYLNDIDYAKSYVCLQYSFGTEVEDSQYYFSSDLLNQGSNAWTWTLNYPITVPLAGERGTYTPVLHLVYLDGSVWDAEGDALYMNDAPAVGDCYPTKLEQSNSTNGTSRTVELDEDAAQVSLGFTGWANVTLTLQAFEAFKNSNNGSLSYMPIDIWNESLGEDAPHITGTPNTLTGYTQVPLQMNSEGASSQTTLYLVEGENVVRYRGLLPNGTYAATKTLVITVRTANPTFEVEFTPNGAGGLRMQLTNLSGDAEEALSLNGRTLRVSDDKTFRESETITLDSNLGLDLTQAEVTTGIWASNPAAIQLMDEYGNFTWQYIYPNRYIDILPPRVTLRQGSNVTVSKGTFCLTADVSDYDNRNDCSEGLDLSSFALTFAYSDGTTVTTPLPDIIPNGTWTGSGAGYGGIYKVEDTATDDTEEGKTRGVDLLIYGQYPYGTTSDRVTITLSCQDNLGNACVDANDYSHTYCTISSGVAYDAAKPTVTSTAGGQGQVTLTSDLPIRVLDPVPADTAGTFAAAHTLPIYTDSAAITYEDVFGNQYTETISASPFEDLSVTLSETAATRGPVTLTATASGENTITGLSSETNGNGTISGSTATLKLTSNDTVTITLSDGTSHRVQVTNIDDKVEQITVVYYDEKGNLLSGNYQSGPVTASLQCSELLVGETSHVFPIGSKAGSSHTFQVTDLLGNAAQITASLPWDLADADGDSTPPTDKTAPQYQVGLYLLRSGAWGQIDQYDSMIESSSPLSPTNLSADLASTQAQAIRLAFAIQDDSPVKVIVKKDGSAAPGYDGESDTIDGLTVTGSTLTWETENASDPLFIYLVDSAGNAADPLTLTFPAVDKTAPAAKVEYVSESGELTLPPIRAYLVPLEDDPSDFTVLDTNQLVLDESDAYNHKGQYYYAFQENGSYTFRFSDAVGNVGSILASVHSIDTTEPEVLSTQWLNQGMDYTGEEWTAAQSNVHTNAPVTAVLTLNTQLEEVQHTETTGVTVSYQTNQAYVTYAANAGALTLTVVARNGKRVEVPLPAITCIDTTAPVVTVKNGNAELPAADGKYTVDGSGLRSVELTFITNEPTAGDLAAAEDGGKFSTTHTYVASKNGETTLSFTDQAGNLTQVTLDIQNLDDRLALSYSRDANGTDAVTDPAELDLQAGDTFYVKPTRKTAITLGEKSPITVEKGQWTAFSLPSEPGLVILKAEDEDKNTLFAYLTVELPDTVAPVISLPSQIVYAQAGITQDAGLALLHDGVSVTDNQDKSVEYAIVTSSVDWNTPGRYTITYTAEDTAQNAISVTRTLVLTLGKPIELRVNGQIVYPGSTLTLCKGDASLTLDGADTPVYLALKQGYKTAAQMKTGSQVLLNGAYTQPLETAFQSSGYYTLYLRTQDRTETIYYLYVRS